MEVKTYFLTKCPKCGDYTPVSRFCRKCGTMNDRMTAELEAVTCPHCGKSVAIGIYCGYCGEKLKEQ